MLVAAHTAYVEGRQTPRKSRSLMNPSPEGGVPFELRAGQVVVNRNALRRCFVVRHKAEALSNSRDESSKGHRKKRTETFYIFKRDIHLKLMGRRDGWEIGGGALRSAEAGRATIIESYSRGDVS